MSNVLPQEKIDRLDDAVKVLNKLTEELTTRSKILAKTEYEYRQAIAKKQLEFRTRGKNEPAALVINYAKGDPIVAKLRYNRDLSRIDVDVCKEQLRNHRMQIEVLRSTLAYDRANYLNQ